MPASQLNLKSTLVLASISSLQLQLPLSGARVCLYEDGTIVTEDFFPTLPANTELVFLSREQTWGGGTLDNVFFQTRQIAHCCPIAVTHEHFFFPFFF